MFRHFRFSSCYWQWNISHFPIKIHFLALTAFYIYNPHFIIVGSTTVDNNIKLNTCSPKTNVEVEWLIFLLSFREVPGSNTGPETGYLD
jgi:hypothetical protein